MQSTVIAPSILAISLAWVEEVDAVLSARRLGALRRDGPLIPNLTISPMVERCASAASPRRSTCT
jgi:hypothetical protein